MPLQEIRPRDFQQLCPKRKVNCNGLLRVLPRDTARKKKPYEVLNVQLGSLVGEDNFSLDDVKLGTHCSVGGWVEKEKRRYIKRTVER